MYKNLGSVIPFLGFGFTFSSSCDPYLRTLCQRDQGSSGILSRDPEAVLVPGDVGRRWPHGSRYIPPPPLSVSSYLSLLVFLSHNLIHSQPLIATQKGPVENTVFVTDPSSVGSQMASIQSLSPSQLSRLFVRGYVLSLRKTEARRITASFFRFSLLSLSPRLGEAFFPLFSFFFLRSSAKKKKSEPLLERFFNEESKETIGFS